MGKKGSRIDELRQERQDREIKEESRSEKLKRRI